MLKICWVTSRLLEEIKEHLWAYLRQQCPFFWQEIAMLALVRFFSKRPLASLLQMKWISFTYQKDAVLKSSILVNFLIRYALQKCELNYNPWPQFVSAIQTQPGKLNRPDCETPTSEPILTSVAHSKFVVTEFSPELMNVIKLYENINVGQTEYKLKGMVRSYNKHFTCEVLIQEKWTYIDLFK